MDLVVGNYYIAPKDYERHGMWKYEGTFYNGYSPPFDLEYKFSTRDGMVLYVRNSSEFRELTLIEKLLYL
jgi:hypothetical protein